MNTTTTTIASQDLVKVTPKSMDRILDQLHAARHVGFFVGRMGTAKSACGRQKANKRGVAYIDFRVATIDPSDLRGVPYHVTEQGRVIGISWASPKALPKDIDFENIIEIEAQTTRIRFDTLNPLGDNNIRHCQEVDIEVSSFTKGLKAVVVRKSLTDFFIKLVDENGESDEPRSGSVFYHIKAEAKAILALDELNSGAKMTLSACYQLLQNFRCGEYIVPAGVQIIAMGNTLRDRGVVSLLPRPLNNRISRYLFELPPEEFLEYAFANRFDPGIVSYLYENTGHISQDDKDIPDDETPFATGRSWENLSNIYNASDDLTPEEMKTHAYSTVGPKYGRTLMDHLNYAHKLPSNDDVLSGRTTRMPSDCDDIAVRVMMVTRLCYALFDENAALERNGVDKMAMSPERQAWFDRADNYIGFVEANFQKEFCIMALKMATKTYRLPLVAPRMQHFEPFARKYSPYVTKSYSSFRRAA